MEIDTDSLVAPSHTIGGGGGSGNAKAIENFMNEKFEAGEKVCDTEIAEMLEFDPKDKKLVALIRNHTNLMRKAGKIAWAGSVKKGQPFEGDHVYTNDKDAFYFDADGNFIVKEKKE